MSVSVELGDTKVAEDGSKPFALFTIYFKFGPITHPLSARYSNLLEFHESLLHDHEGAKVFSGRFAQDAVFPAKRWFADMTKPKNYNARAEELLQYFIKLLKNPEILKLQVFHDGLGLDDTTRTDLVQMAEGMSGSDSSKRDSQTAQRSGSKIQDSKSLVTREFFDTLLDNAQQRFIDVGQKPNFLGEEELEERRKKYIPYTKQADSHSSPDSAGLLSLLFSLPRSTLDSHETKDQDFDEKIFQTLCEPLPVVKTSLYTAGTADTADTVDKSEDQLSEEKILSTDFITQTAKKVSTITNTIQLKSDEFDLLIHFEED